MDDRIEDHNFAVDLCRHKGYSRIYFDTTWHNPASHVRDGWYGCRVKSLSRATGECGRLLRPFSFRGSVCTGGAVEVAEGEDGGGLAAAVEEALDRIKDSAKGLEGEVLLAASLRCEALLRYVLPRFAE